MKPYYKNELTTIYNGDCLEVMEHLINNYIFVDAIITDPPYGMSFQSGARADKHKKIKNDDNLKWLPTYMSLINDILKDNSPVLMFCSWHKVDIFKREFEKHFTLKNILIWDKQGNGMGDLTGAFGGTYEMILYGTKGRVELNGDRDRDVVYSRRTGNNLHPTQKPIDLIQYFIQKITKPHHLVLDTFAGSFTTSVACEELNRKNIGIELDKTYCEVGVDRINNLQLKFDI